MTLEPRGPNTRATGDPYGGTDPRLIPAYTTFEAARYLRIPERTLFNWSFGRSYRSAQGAREVPPLIDPANAQRHALSFTNLAELHVLDSLRRIHQLEMRKIRRTLLYMRRAFETDHPLIHQEMWTDGMNLFVDHYGHLVNASQEGQLAMRQLLAAHLTRIDRDVTGIIRLFPLTRKRPTSIEAIATEPRIIAIDPQVAWGRPVIAGSRTPTVEIAERFKAGESLEELANDFGRPIAEIEEAVRLELNLEQAA